ncbi:TonB-dependent siderophore myxochelin receptor MxcH [Haliangium ochraceum]|uniref:TonB family protein n=1 Tax=Haliangium ochraceum (strain DSM 14365 / JCM 11303 / SMP-2) TaxID=502025 RepID=D0LFX1_HALO1|nr:TonB-dependent siderophore myxochelin receptor MxcH [Haliangium ochraceum]ACY14573.1 TonB family protein [Haliangium ochraceum DSM 14365]
MLRASHRLVQPALLCIAALCLSGIAPPSEARAQAAAAPGVDQVSDDTDAGAGAGAGVAPAPAPAASAADAVQPPVLVHFVEAEYPAAARSEGRAGSVDLLLSIDARGRVTAAEIAASAGPDFDSAARAAALAFRFEPARRGGVAMPARIRYRYAFALPEAPDADAASADADATADAAVPAAPPARAAASGALVGSLRIPGRAREPVAGASITLTAADGSTRSATSDERGGFRIDALAPGAYDVRAAAPGFEPGLLRTEIVPGRAAEIALVLAPTVGGAADQVLEVTVRGSRAGERLHNSAQAVRVVETEQAQQQSADLGEVLARTEGVDVRRSGGLGSDARLSLGGLSGDQIRTFLDGIPLALAGYPLGIANVPVNQVERIEIYRGVVPVRFGTDALGGAINLVSDGAERRADGASASYQTGAFDTHRLTLGARRLLHPASGLFARVNGYYDRARNDYPIDVDVPDASGRLVAGRARRFHDGYRALGAGAEIGVSRQPWAEHLSLRGFVGEHARDLQHNLLATVPYGEATYGKYSAGAHLRYAQPLSERARVDAVAGYSYIRTTFRDLATCRYDWYGRCVANLPQAGEIEALASDQRVRQNVLFAHLGLTWTPAPTHALRVALAPRHTSQRGENRALPAEDYDPLAARRTLSSAVFGAEYEIDAWAERLTNIAFIKSYLQRARSDERLPNGTIRELDRLTPRLGVGDSLRLQLTDELSLKSSYELATRLPRPEELFGNGGLIVENLHLDPETSHNLNLDLQFEREDQALGHMRVRVGGFGRFTRDLIVLLGTGSYQQYENVYAARSLGVETTAGWQSPGQRLALEGALTWQDFRNAADEDSDDPFAGDRIPNHPHLFASGSARVQWPALLQPGDALALTWHTRYVHAFFRSWESAGAADSKLQVPSQLIHTPALSYRVEREGRAASFTIELQNLSDERVFDFFGVQRPGRAAYAKLVLDM